MLKASVKRDTVCVLVVLAVIGFFSCGRGKEPLAKTETSKPVLVRTLRIPVGDDAQTRSFPIFAKEAQTVKLSFRVPGQLLEFDPILGARVAKDDVVAKLDPRDYQLAVDRLEQGIVEAEALLKAMKSGARAEDIAALQSQVLGAETAAANAKKQLARMENLHADGTASDIQYDIAKTTSDAATAHWETLKTQLEKAQKGARAEEIEAMEAKIAGLRVDLALAANKLADTRLKAPFSGIIAEKFHDNHEYVAPGFPVIELVNADAMEATLNVSEEIVRNKDKIEKIECRFQSIPDRVYTAAIKEIGQTVQRGNLAYPLTVWIDLAQDGGETRLLAGMVGTATVTLQCAPKAITIPTAALIPNDSADQGAEGSAVGNTDGAAEGGAAAESAVWLYDETSGALTRRPVHISAFTESGAVVADGLAGGETVVSAGARFLSEGETVRVDEEPAALSK